MTLGVRSVHLHRRVISELASSQSFRDSQVSCFPELRDVCHQICSSVNERETKTDDEADEVRDGMGDDAPIALQLVCPLIWRGERDGFGCHEEQRSAAWP